MENTNNMLNTEKTIPVFGKRKSKEKGYMNFTSSETQKNLFKEKIDEEIEEKGFWVGLLGLVIFSIFFVIIVLFYGIHAIKELWKNLVNFFNF